MFRATHRPLRRDPRARNAVSAGRPGLGRAHRLGPRPGEELAARLLRHAGALAAGLAAGLVWQSARGTVTPWVVAGRQARPGAGRRAGDRRLPADRSADRLAPRALHRGGAQHPGRSGRAAPELARRLRLRHRQGRAGAQRLCAHQRSVRQDRQDASRGRGVERDPRLGRQLPRRLDRAPLRRRRARRDRTLERHPHHRHRSRRPTPTGCARTRSASMSTPSTGRRSSADARSRSSRALVAAFGIALAACSTWKPPADRL